MPALRQQTGLKTVLALFGGLAASVMIAEAALYSIENTPLWRVMPLPQAIA